MYWHEVVWTMKRRKILEGDVFRFKARPDEWSYGHVLISRILQFVIVFEPIFDSDPNLDDLVEMPPLFSGWTADARFLSGDWEVVGNIPPVGDFVFPEYKVGQSGQTWVTDVHGKLLRLATADEERRLGFNGSHAPIAFEKATRAWHGDFPWESYFDELRVEQRAN
jgi:hypothetical protein